MRFFLNSKLIRLMIISVLLSSVPACTLRKRNKPGEAVESPGAKATLATPIPTSTHAPITPRPEINRDEAPSPNREELVQADLNEYNNPTVAKATLAEIEAENQQSPVKKRFTGFTNEKGNAYTDASPDYLMPYLRTEQNSLPGSQMKDRSLAFARSLQEVTLIDAAGSHFTVRIKYTVAKSNKTTTETIKLTGHAEKNHRYFALSEKQTGTLKGKVTSKIRGELRCLDLNVEPDCNTYLLQLKTKKTEDATTAEVILRKTSATAKISVPNTPGSTPAFDELKEALVNSTLKTPQGRYFESFEMQSFAVVNGRAGFQIRMMTNQNEYLYFSGPLLTNFGNAPMQVLLKKKPDIQDPVNAHWALGGSGYFTTFIHSARLIQNNGQGTLGLSLTTRDTNPSSTSPVFKLEFKPSVQPIVELNQDSIYFSP